MRIVRVKKLIFSTKVPARIEDLRKQMSENEYLTEILTTPAKELIEKYPEYSYLTDSDTLEFEGGTRLLSVIKTAIKGVPSQSFFSVDGNKITGFFAYLINDENVVTDIKMFSFYTKNFNTTLARDMIEVLDVLRTKYVEVNWKAVPDNPICKAYDRVVKQYNGVKREIISDGKLLVQYTIPGEK